MKTLLGIDLFEEKIPKKFYKKRAGVLTHPAGVDSNLKSSFEVIIKSKKVKVVALFGPQHGFTGHTQDNMIEWETFIHPELKIPVYSLYGKKREPEEEWLKNLDLLIIDLQDVGSRYYTFIWTMALCFKVCEKLGIPVLVLDRPNPISCNRVEGFMLEEKFSSFVGLHPLITRHGLTISEIALYFKENFYKNLDLNFILMKNYKRDYFFEDTKLKWVMPSPNMPSEETALLYPGMCLLEGTNLSEGRGTIKPFEIFGAPFFDEKIEREIKKLKDESVFFRPLHFEPTFNKYKGQICKGFQIHILNKKKLKSFSLAYKILKISLQLYPDKFKWKEPPYEYEYEKLPIDILSGTDFLRKSIEENLPFEKFEEREREDCRIFNKIRKEFFLYK
ncbi:MAG: DUF1343 domain-containing protein [Thermoanaerobaculia bacterium]